MGNSVLCCLVLLICCAFSQSEQTLTFEKPRNWKNVKTSNCTSADCFKRKPVLMVPGVLGTQLKAKLDKPSVPRFFCDRHADWYSLWLNLEQFLPDIVDCWVDNIRMIYDNKTRKIENNKGVQIRVPRFGSTEAFEYLDTDKYAVGSVYFEPLVSHLVDTWGYTRGKDLVGGPFDWRLAPAQHKTFLKNLTALTEETYYNNGNKKVVVLGHSMGNMFLYYWLKNQPMAWKNKFIDTFVSISGPYLGSVKALKAVTSGETEGHDWALPRLKLRDAVRTAPAFPFMFPRPDLWPKNKRTVVVTFKRNYTVNDYESLFQRIGCEWCYDLWKDNGMALGSLKAPSVPVHCIYSSQVPTAETLIYDEDLFPDDSPSLVDGSGDGTVNVWSGSACLQWRKTQQQPVYKFEMPGNSHVKILWNSTLHHYLKHVVLR